MCRWRPEGHTPDTGSRLYWTRVEARIEAHECWDFELPNEQGIREYCQSLLMDKPHDVHSKTAEKISKILGRKFERTPAKSIKYGCLPTDNTEVLTPEGWKKPSDLQEGMYVLSYSKEKDGYEYTPVTTLYHYSGAGVGILRNKWFSVEVTEDHEWIVRRRTGKKERYFVTEKWETRNLNTETNIIGSARSLLSSEFTDNECEFMGWLLSDGYFKWSGSSRNSTMGLNVSIDQSSKKFAKEIRECLKKFGQFREYSSGDMVKFVPDRNKVRELFTKIGIAQGVNKHEFEWVRWVANLSYDNLQAFLKAFWLGDGTPSGKNKIIKQNNGQICEAVRLAVNMTGRMVYGNTSVKATTFSVSGRQTVSGQRLQFIPSRTTDVFCLSNKNESFVVRQNGQIVLTGNCTYGAQAAKVAKQLGVPLSVGQTVYNAFWEAARPLKDLKEYVKTEWEGFGKKHIMGIDGRKVPTRAEHAILNSRFQSGGVICAKRAMVIHDRLLKKEGLSIDFFKECRYNKPLCQQLVSYHDEAQLEVTKSLVEFKTFATKEECDQFKETELANGKIWSDIKEAKNGGFFVAYSRAGELASQAVHQAGRDYGLNVDLTAGYVLGRNWKDCH